jgi:hypothetical protein
MSMKNVKVLVKRRVKAIGIDLVLDSDYFLQSLSPSLFQQLRFPRFAGPLESLNASCSATGSPSA